ncbi:MAG: membrane protein insertase YidC [Fibrobacteres bacterium]|nr:membrane protein insertase YidC [Fibrobacterota bacterium]
MFNKNFIIAFALIFASFVFFNGDFWNYKILGKEKPVPASAAPAAEKSVKTHTSAPAEIKETTENKLAPVDSTVLSVDSLKQLSKTIIVSNGLYTARISTYGAIATAWSIPEYKDFKGKTYNLVSDTALGIFNLEIEGVDFDKTLFTTDAPDSQYITTETSISFKTVTLEGKTVEKVFTFRPKAYDITVKLSSTDNIKGKYQFGWKGGIRESEKDVDTKLADQSLTFYLGGEEDDVDRPVENDDTAKDVEGLLKWASLRSKYFSGTFVPDSVGDFTVYTRKIAKTEESGNPLNFSLVYEGRLEQGSALYKVILIPSRHSILTSYNIQLEKILFKGYAVFFKADIWFPKLCGLLLTLLNYFYGLIPNYGIAILLLTLLTKIVTLPLTIKSTRSMARMKLMAPKIKVIQEKHKGDPMAQQQAMMKMYKDEGISPLGGAGGCLPMILQMPIFIALFVALRKAIELRGADFAFWIHDLSAPEVLVALPFSIPFFGAHLSLLNIIMAVSMFFQSKQTMTGNDPNQKMMVYFMPVMMFFMFNNMPAGLLLYWSLSNILGIAQNFFIKFDPEELKKDTVKKKKSLWGKKPSYNEILKRMGKK